MKRVKRGGGWHAVKYTFKKAREAGGLVKLYKAMRTKNACKTCALGMGGQRGGMVNEQGHFPEVCKKSLQAMVADMQPAISADFWKQHSIDDLCRMTPRELEASGRLADPVIHRRGSSHYEPITWDAALARIAERLKGITPDESFWYFSGRSSNEAGFLLQLFARIFGTNNVNNCSYYCHQASGVGLSSVTGSGTATIQLDDLEHADLVFLIGGNPASNHPRMMRSLMQVRRRGGKVIVINPVIETGLVNFSVPSDPLSLFFGTKIATQYVQPDIGGDLALLWGIAKRIVELGAADEEFLNSHCHTWPEVKERLAALDWQEVLAKSGVTQDQIEQIATTYAAAKNVVFSWTMGITHHAHGVQNVQAICNLALLRGMVGRPKAGLLPIRGHSNVQGIGSVGVTPKLKDAIFESLQQHYGVKLPTSEGLDTLGCMEATDAGTMKVGFCLGGNLYGSNPDAAFAQQSLAKLDQIVYLNTTLNTGHAHGLAEETIILPVLARDEEPQITTQESMFNFVRYSDGGPQRFLGPKSEIAVIAALAVRVLGGDGSGPIDWRAMGDARTIRAAIARVVPGYAELETSEETKQEFQLADRTFYKPQFATSDGKAQLHVHDLPPLAGSHDQLRLMTVRSEGQFNTVVYEDDDLYRGIEGRDVILLHPVDMETLGLKENSRVTVRSTTGEMPGIRAIRFDSIKAGNALMYYPEANLLVPRTVDAQSRTPAFKCLLVEVLAE